MSSTSTSTGRVWGVGDKETKELSKEAEYAGTQKRNIGNAAFCLKHNKEERQQQHQRTTSARPVSRRPPSLEATGRWLVYIYIYIYIYIVLDYFLPNQTLRERPKVFVQRADKLLHAWLYSGHFWSRSSYTRERTSTRGRTASYEFNEFCN